MSILYPSESGCKFGDRCSFAHRQVEGQPSKKPKKDGDKSAVAQDSWVAYFRTQNRRNLYRFYVRAQKSWDQFDECDSQKLRSVMQTSEKTKVRRSENSSQSSSSTQSVRFEILGQFSGGD